MSLNNCVAIEIGTGNSEIITEGSSFNLIIVFSYSLFNYSVFN